MFDHILLLLLLAADVLCWYEARRSGNVMQMYFRERRKWYAARSKPPSPKSGLGTENSSSKQ